MKVSYTRFVAADQTMTEYYLGHSNICLDPAKARIRGPDALTEKDLNLS